MNPLQTLIVLIWVVAAAVVATIIGSRKGRPWTGFLLGLLLGWIGVIIIAVTSPTRARRVERERERLQIQREARES
jgi:predicted membrane channel-forming protein YqfA (hemolysin III family)